MPPERLPVSILTGMPTQLCESNAKVRSQRSRVLGRHLCEHKVILVHITLAQGTVHRVENACPAIRGCDENLAHNEPSQLGLAVEDDWMAAEQFSRNGFRDSLFQNGNFRSEGCRHHERVSSDDFRCFCSVNTLSTIDANDSGCGLVHTRQYIEGVLDGNESCGSDLCRGQRAGQRLSL